MRRLVGQLVGCLVGDRSMGWSIASSFSCSVCGLVRGLFGLLVSWLACSLVDQFVTYSVGGLVVQYVCRSFVRLIGWFVCGLVGWLEGSNVEDIMKGWARSIYPFEETQ